ncbi:hypothetical protein ONZ45_g7066 [Pleurotus djamor]|nr:hypothetical protein ONZ45_g7066 [Pleurotus djamor]
MLPLCDSTSLLIHEATDTHMPFEVSASLSKRSPEVVMEKTLAKGHSTPAMAGEFAKKVGAQKLVLNHISSRFPAPRYARDFQRISVIEEIERQATAAWDTPGCAAKAAWDYMRVVVPANEEDVQAVPTSSRVLQAMDVPEVLRSFVLNSHLRDIGCSRVCGFISVWLLTADFTLPRTVKDSALAFIWAILVAACTSFVASLLILRWSSAQFAVDIVASFSKAHECLYYRLDTAFSNLPLAHHPASLTAHEQLLKLSVALNQSYAQATFELRIGRVGVKSIKPLIGTIEHIRRELSWGISYPRPTHLSSPEEADIIQAFRGPASELGDAILVAIKACEHSVSACFESTRFTSSRSLVNEKSQLQEASNRLQKAILTARGELKDFTDDLDLQQRSSDGELGFTQKTFNLCLFMISLLQMAHEMRHALHLCQKLIVFYETSPLRLWHPRVSLAWLGAAPTTYINEERGAQLDDDDPSDSNTLGPSKEETLQGITENQYDSNADDDAETTTDEKPAFLRQRKIPGKPLTPRWMAGLVRYAWNSPIMLRLRLRSSRAIRSFQHSSHLRHAFKIAAGIMILSIPAFLPPSSSGYAWFYWTRGQWMVLSYLWVLETSTGATWRVAYLRISGTILGCTYAYITYLICGRNPYGLVAMVTLAEIPISWIIINTDFQTLGVVSSITLPPLTFMTYFNPDIQPSQIVLVALRGAMIATGIIAALFVNSAFFPRHCRALFLNNTGRTIGLISQLYLTLSRTVGSDLFSNAMMSSVLEKQKVLKIEVGVRNALHRMNLLIITMSDELSLVPKPMKRYRQIVTVLQKLLDLLTALRKIREKIPRKETVTAVAAQRREFVSCVCISLFAAEQVFRARQSLPQFLPSPRQALTTLEHHVEDRIRQARAEEVHSLGLAVVYTFAETDVLRELVETLDDLLELSRQLFGTSAWYTSQVDMTVMSWMHEEIGGTGGTVSRNG